MLNEFINYLLEQVANHSIYVRGGQGQNDITDDFINTREYGDETNIKRVKALRDNYYKLGYKNVMRAFDCSGLGMYWLQNIKNIYADMTANGMMGKCNIISRESVKRGDWVFITDKSGRATHIGFMINDTMLIEARGRDYGVIISILDDRFNKYGRPKVFENEIENQNNKAMEDMQTLCSIINKYSEV